jgi:hypothetical protein
MALFRDMYPTRVIASEHDFLELERMLIEAIARGFAKEIVVNRKLRPEQIIGLQRELWFLDIESGEIHSLTFPHETLMWKLGEYFPGRNRSDIFHYSMIWHKWQS